MKAATEKASQGPHRKMRPFVEFAIVFGLCAFGYFVVIPAGTAESDNFGLSPRLLPSVTIGAIALLSFLSLLAALLKPSAAEARPTAGLLSVLFIILTAVAGILAIDKVGLVAGGVTMVVVLSFVVGERRPLPLLAMAAIALAVLLLVDWSGL